MNMAADEPTPLFSSKKECIDTVHDLARSIKAGEVTGFLAILMDPNGDCSVSWAGDFSLSEMVGSLEIAKAQLVDAAYAEAEAR